MSMSRDPHRATARRRPGPLARFLRRFRDEGGAVAIWFAALALPLAVLSFALIDVNRASVEKRHLQDALDAATLLAARSTATTDAELQAIGAAALTAQLSGMSNATLQSSSFTLSGTTIVGAASASVTPVIANLWLQGDMQVGAEAEVLRASTNLEVAMVLDITGSMRGTKLADMKTAAKDLVDMVVQDAQTPFYSKVALVPFSRGVNAGSYAASARGAVTAATSITGASWSTGASKSISAATRASPVKITTTSSHGFNNGDVVWISGVSGMTQINNRAFVVAGKTGTTFQLQGVNGTSYSSYWSGGTVRKCQVADCSIVVTSASHGLSNGTSVYITNVGGMSQINDRLFTVANRTASTFSLSGVNGASYGAYTSGGTAACVIAGCQYYRFTNAEGNATTFEISTCVSERTGLAAYTDAAPSGSPVGRVYLSDITDCPTSSIVPLSSDKTALKASITGYTDGGSTAGQIGTAWGWYMLAPNFGYLWPSASQPAAYAAPDVLKVVVMMTDGEFNTNYCNGVLAQNAGTGANSQQINCNATNGDGTVQALSQCTAMKAAGVVVYTIGFDLGGNATAENFIRTCATDSDHVYLPSGGGALKDAFAAIGQDIMALRLSK